MTTPLLSVRDLRVHFPLRKSGVAGFFAPRSVVRAVDGVSFDIAEGETLGLVGESGCGKSTTGRAVLGLVAATGGQVFHAGRDIARMSPAEVHATRRDRQMIFQNPYASLDPRMTIGNIIAEPLRAHGRSTEGIGDLMETVGLDPKFIQRYPHEFSGGQRQRIGIARALALKPKFIVADEPIAALDVSIQAQILNLLKSLRKKFGLTYLFISHDLRAVRVISTRIAVMYLGKIVEIGDARTVYQQPKHPYTQALLSAVPVADPKIERTRQRIVLRGDAPSPVNPPAGCRFHTRCPHVMPVCREKEPALRDVGDGRRAACFLHETG